MESNEKQALKAKSYLGKALEEIKKIKVTSQKQSDIVNSMSESFEQLTKEVERLELIDSFKY